MTISVERERVGEEDDLTHQLLDSLQNSRLHLILLPTEQCNFRCTYCYEDFEIGRMKSETIQAIKRLIWRRADGLTSLSISWFGGEPLLAQAVVEEISGHIVEISKANPSLNYDADMTTNGYLLNRRVAGRLAELGITLFQVSLDGPEEHHNKTRVRYSGKGSFDTIWRNLVSIRESDLPVEVLLRVHLTPTNVLSMPDFLVRIRDIFLSDSRFSVLLKPVERMGGPHNDTIDSLEEDERASAIRELEPILQASRANSLYSGPTICYAAAANSFMIRADGTVGKCTVALNDPSNSIGRIKADGGLEISNDQLRPWLRGWEGFDIAALSCPYVGLPKQEPLLQITRRRLTRLESSRNDTLSTGI